MTTDGLTREQRMDQLRSFERTAYHLEVQPFYAVELDLFARWQSGDHRPPATTSVSLAAWYELVAAHTSAGRTMERVRVLDEPPTEYQRFELWCGQWNVQAGEVLRSISRSRAVEVGLVPGVGHADWWLLDDERLMVSPFDDSGSIIDAHLTTDPDTVAAARGWWDLAVAHASIDDPTVTR